MKEERMWRWIVNGISLLLTLLILGAALALLIAKKENKPVFIFGYTAVWIQSGSMEDTIPTDSYILVKRTTAAEVEVGDVIMFYSDDPELHGDFNTHRVVDIIGDHEEFVTKGDNNSGRDAKNARGEKVVGRYVRNMPVLTAIGRLFRTTLGLVLLFAVTLISVALTFIGRKGPKKADPAADFDARVAAEVERLAAADRQKQAENGKGKDDMPSREDEPSENDKRGG